MRPERDVSITTPWMAARGVVQAHLVEQAFVQQRRHGLGPALGIG